MPFAKSPDAKDARRPTGARKIIIGRAEELHFFRENILKPEDPAYNIVSIAGQGGVGKSTLLLRFIDDAHATDFKDYCLTALVDERQTTPASIMEKFADQLHLEGDFEKALRQYKEVLRKLQSQREAAREAFMRKTATEVVGSVAQAVPVVGGVLKEGALAATTYVLEELHYRQLLKDAERMEGPIGDLTSVFVRELNRLTETSITMSSSRRQRQRVILFFDTFEQLAAECAPWLLDYFLVADISNNVVLVIAGRDALEDTIPDEPKRWLPYRDSNTIYSISLNSFTEEETRRYLAERGITDTERIETIWQLSHGLPLYLGFLTSNPQGKVDPTANVVANFLRWIPEQEQVKRRLALDAALFSRPFNQDELGAFAYISEQERPNLYRWLTAQPFVRNNQDGRYSYQGLAQEMFSRYLFQSSQEEYYDTRRAIADHCQRMLEEFQIEGIKTPSHAREWSELTLALTYQLFLLQDETRYNKAIEYVLNIYELTEQTNEIVKILHELFEDSLNNFVSSEAKLIIGSLLHYIESDPLTQTFLTATNNILDRVAHESSISSELLARIYLKRGQAYFSLEEYRQAIEDFDRVIDLDPHVARTYDIRNLMYHLQLRKEYNQIIEDFTHMLEIESGDIETYIRRGLAYLSLQEYDRALGDLDYALASRTDLAWVYIYRGQTNIGRQEYDRALEDFTQALALEPKNNWTYIRLGQVYASRQEYDRALEDFTQALALEPKDVLTYIRRGQTYISIQEYDHALEDFTQALALEPKHVLTYIRRGQTYISIQEYDRAIEDFDRVLKIDPENALVYAWRGLAYLWLEDLEQAINNYIRSWELSRLNFNAGLLIEWSKMCLQDARRLSTERLEIIIATDPQHYLAHVCHGIMIWQTENFEKALLEIDEAIAMNAENWEAYFWRGMICAYLGCDEMALSSLEKSLANGLPPVLLSPLHWLERERPDFYSIYAKPLLARF